MLQRCGDELTRENLLKQATSIKGARVARLCRGSSSATRRTTMRCTTSCGSPGFDGTGWVLFGAAVSGRD